MPPEEIKEEEMYYFCCQCSYGKNEKKVYRDYEKMTKEDIFKNVLSCTNNVKDRIDIINCYRSGGDIFDLVDYSTSIIKKEQPDFYMNISSKKPYNGDMKISKEGWIYVTVDGRDYKLEEAYVSVRPDSENPDRENITYDLRALHSDIENGIAEELPRRRVVLDDESILRRDIGDSIVYSPPVSNEISETEQ